MAIPPVPGLMMPVVPGVLVVPPGVPVVPPVATNAAFLNVYTLIPAANQYGFETQIWAELHLVDPTVDRIHNFGRHYIDQLNQVSYGALSPPLQDAIAQDAWTAAAGAPLAPPAVMHLFVRNMLP